MTMVALTPILQGQQIFNDYGQLPRSDLLVSQVLGVIALYPITNPKITKHKLRMFTR